MVLFDAKNMCIGMILLSHEWLFEWIMTLTPQQHNLTKLSEVSPVKSSSRAGVHKKTASVHTLK